jgi:DNA-binding XRE family transcriptional regulator
MPETNFISGQTIIDIRETLKLNRGEYTDLIGTSRNTLKKWEEEGLNSFTSAAERNMKNLYTLYITNIVDNSLINIDESDSKREILFALSTLVGVAEGLGTSFVEVLSNKTIELFQIILKQKISEDYENLQKGSYGFDKQDFKSIANIVSLTNTLNFYDSNVQKLIIDYKEDFKKVIERTVERIKKEDKK